ncbi:hypothetical protein [Chryseobacterium sp. JK1]|uniref:hypothetical protein n=1 Tax=Chryseobacterium sp. JK1 TaxID=874294 RepID=UPI003D685815
MDNLSSVFIIYNHSGNHESYSKKQWRNISMSEHPGSFPGGSYFHNNSQAKTRQDQNNTQ